MIRWTFAPEWQSHSETLFGAADTETVKHGIHRTVERLTSSAGIFYRKHCRIPGLRSWLRQCVRPPKAKMEFDRMRAVRARGIGTAEAVAWGIYSDRRRRDSFLITCAIPNARSLADIFESEFHKWPAPEQHRFTRIWGQFVGKLHAAGIVHRDFHPGNVLYDGSQFHLLDLHDLTLRSSLSISQRRANLVMLNRWFALRATRMERRRFLTGYGGTANDATAIETMTPASLQKLWRNRAKTTFGTNRRVRRVRSQVFVGHAARDLPEVWLTRVLHDPDAPFTDAAAVILKQSKSGVVARIPWGEGFAIYKRFHATKRTDGLRNRLALSPTLRSWAMGYALRERGLPTPEPLFAGHRVGRFGWGNGYLLCRFVPAAKPLSEVYAPTFIEPLARLIRTLHERGLAHRDLKAANILVDRQGVFHFVDLVGVSESDPVSFARRVKNLARLNMSAEALQIPRRDRVRFLQTYLAGKPWKQWARAIHTATLLKITSNQKRGRPLG